MSGGMSSRFSSPLTWQRFRHFRRAADSSATVILRSAAGHISSSLTSAFAGSGSSRLASPFQIRSLVAFANTALMLLLPTGLGCIALVSLLVRKLGLGL